MGHYHLKSEISEAYHNGGIVSVCYHYGQIWWEAVKGFIFTQSGRALMTKSGRMIKTKNG